MEALQKWGMNTDHRGAPKFISWFLACGPKGLSTIQQEEQLLSVMLLLVSELFILPDDIFHVKLNQFKSRWGQQNKGLCSWMKLLIRGIPENVLCKQISLCSQPRGAKNTSDRIWSPLVRLEDSDVTQEDVQHQCHCGTSKRKETQESGSVCVSEGGERILWWLLGQQKAKFTWHRKSPLAWVSQLNARL